MTRIIVIAVAAVAVLAAAGAVVIGASRDAAAPGPHADVAPHDCVVVAPDEHGELHTTPTSCDTDLSFIVSGLVGGDDEDCASDPTFPEPFGDARTATLCLVPNFTAGHCYEFAIPSGMFALTDCGTDSPAVLRIDAKHESADEGLCSEDSGHRALTYRSLPLTYCTSNMGLK